MRILVTGGAGYVGSHTAVVLLQAGHDLVVVDNLSNSKRDAIRRVEELGGRPVAFHRVDLRDREALDAVFRDDPVDAVIHFAALKAVGESVAQPLRYFQNNITGTLVLCDVMQAHGVKTMVFSSSATVYGSPHAVPITEDFPLASVNPYGRSKVACEGILQDVHRADPEWRIALLRYFNPVGAHESGRIGEDPNGVPNNLMPYIAQVAVGRLPELRVFGGDYPTEDGTGVRDYIHVMDLAEGHVRALERIARRPGVLAVNLGTGRGHSVLEVLHAFERAVGRALPFRITDRRPGDVAACWADVSLARHELDWVATRDLDAMCADAWRWQQANPDGFPDA
jgi:UDP-glucose 4-epimerase